MPPALDLGPDLPAARRVVVIGLARSGRAAVRALRRRGVDVVATDARPAENLVDLPAEEPGLRTAVGGHPADLFDGADLAVASPGIPPDAAVLAEARARGIPVVPEVELAYRLRGAAAVVGVTGTNGKSTTTALVAALLRDAGRDAVACGNIGLPWCEAVDRPGLPGAGPRVDVVELSSYQLEGVRALRCDAAVILNVTPDHLDRHRTFAAYAAAKLRILERTTAEAVVVVNADDPVCGLVDGPFRRLRFSRRRALDRGAWLAGDVFVVDAGRGPRQIAPRSALGLVGDHNVENALAALAAAVPLGATAATAARTFASFRALPHRCALVRRRGGVDWYDDSKGTNVDATLKALAGFPDRSVWAILGGKDKGDDFARLAVALAWKARGVLLIGAAADRLAAALARDAAAVDVRQVGVLDAAVAAAAKAARPGDVVLLSPACASFDQFRDYEHRGDAFAALVAALPPAEDGT